MGEAIDVEALREGFTFAYFERVDPERNARRYYYLAWQESALGEWCVVRIRGRLGGQEQRLPLQPFPDLAAAWPMIRATIRRRLRHGYRLLASMHASK